MKFFFILSALSCIVFFSCKVQKPETIIKKDSTEKMTIKKDTSFIIKKEMKTNTGKTFTIIESKPSYSVSNFDISGVGFENSTDTIKYPNQNPMVTALVADLDKNGFDEVYILTKATGSGSFMDILGVASNKDKSFGEIHIQEITDKDVSKNEKFSGYMGHDSIYISDNKLIREFPVYKNSDANSDPTGGRRKVIYMLKPGEEAYQLMITGAEEIK